MSVTSKVAAVDTAYPPTAYPLDRADATSSTTARVGSRGFLVALALVTLVPLVGVPLYMLLRGAFPGSVAVLAMTGPMHVAASSFFYFDRAFRPVIGESRRSCVWSLAWAPLTVLAVGVAATALLGLFWAYLFVFAFQNAWLFYHYQRQNFGLLSFVSKKVGCGRLPRRVSDALNLAALGGFVSMVGVPGFCLNTEGILTAQASQVLWFAGASVYACSLALMIWVLYSEPRLRENDWLTAGLILGIGFFLPSIVFRSLALGFLPYAIAHGAQYILMMSVLSGRSSRGLLALLTMCVLAVTIGLAIDSMKAWPAILVATGIVQVHFMIDAKVWRLREPRQRAIMNDRFDFMLAH